MHRLGRHSDLGGDIFFFLLLVDTNEEQMSKYYNTAMELGKVGGGGHRPPT